MLKRTILAAALATVLTVSAYADPTPAANLFIQVWFDKDLPSTIDPSEDPGRIEVEIGGRFVGCAVAGFYEDKWDQIHLVPLSVGFTTHGDKSAVKVQALGALTKFPMRIKVSEIPAVPDKKP